MLKKAEAYWPLILLLAIVKFVLPVFLQSPVYELHRDEFLYYEQGLHPALGYLENPPLISWLGTISSWFGGSEAWIKLWPSLFGAATLVVACLITAELGGKLFAQFLTGLSIMTGAFMRMHFLFQPNMLDVFFWTLAIYFIIRYISEDRDKWLYAFIVSLALGFWGKYSVLFVAAALLLALLVSQHRIVFAKKKFYLAALLGLVIIAPNIWWQYQHNWPLIHHMEELQEKQLKYMNPLVFLSEQFFFLLPVAFVWLAGLIWYFKNKQWRFLAYTYGFVLLLLIAGRGKAYYAAGIYPMLLAAGGIAWEQLSEKKQWIRYAFCIFIIGFSFMITPLLLPVWEPAKLSAFHKQNGVDHKWEDQQKHDLPQDFADMLGWKELAQKAERFYLSLPDTVRSGTAILCSNYGEAGALKYYGKDSSFTRKVVSTNGSFLLWMPPSFQFRHLIFVDEDLPGKDHPLFSLFESNRVVDSVTNTYSRQLGEKVIFYENADTSALQKAKGMLQERKKQFSR